MPNRLFTTILSNVDTEFQFFTFYFSSSLVSFMSKFQSCFKGSSDMLLISTFDEAVFVVRFDKAGSDELALDRVASADLVENRRLPSSVVSIATSKNSFCVAYLTP
jgi:hypothetical protein